MVIIPGVKVIIIIIINEYYYGGAVALLLQDHLTKWLVSVNFVVVKWSINL